MLMNLVITNFLPDRSEIKRLRDAPEELKVSADFWAFFGFWQ